MALIATQTCGAAGLVTPTMSAANASDTFVPDDRTFIYCTNTNAATRTLAVTTPGTLRGQSIGDYTTGAIPATTGVALLGPFPADTYADPTTGLATVTPSATAGVSYAIVRLAVI